MIKREDLGGQNRMPRFPIQACSAPVAYETEQSAEFFLRSRREELLFVNSLPTASFVPREIVFFCKFWEGTRFRSEPLLLRILDFVAQNGESVIFNQSIYGIMQW